MDKYELMEKLGQGAYGSVWKARNKETNQIVALKSVKIPSDIVRNLLKNEVNILKAISDPCYTFLTCYIDDFIYKKTLYIVMEYIDGVTLKKFAADLRNSGDLTNLYKYLVAIASDMSKALNYLHSHDIIHRDIKPENIMINKQGIPKLIDIGLGCFVTEICSLRADKLDCCLGAPGTPNFMAPETLLNRQSYYASDLWGLGATLYNSATNRYVYEPDPPTVQGLRVAMRYTPPSQLNTSNAKLNNLVNSMLKKDPTRRSIPEQYLE